MPATAYDAPLGPGPCRAGTSLGLDGCSPRAAFLVQAPALGEQRVPVCAEHLAVVIVGLDVECRVKPVPLDP